MPGASVFIDSTTFLYTVDDAEREKAERARNWLEALTLADAGVTNLQVLNEVASVITRKIGRFGPYDAFVAIDAFASFGSASLTPSASLAARLLFHRFDYSWWDCLLLASAIEMGCTTFLSEDLQDGQIIAADDRTLTILNPFAHSPADALSLRP